MDGRAGDEQMADDELLPSAPEPDEPEPADRFSYEIEEFIAERQALQTSRSQRLDRAAQFLG